MDHVAPPRTSPATQWSPAPVRTSNYVSSSDGTSTAEHSSSAGTAASSSTLGGAEELPRPGVPVDVPVGGVPGGGVVPSADWHETTPRRNYGGGAAPAEQADDRRILSVSPLRGLSLDRLTWLRDPRTGLPRPVSMGVLQAVMAARGAGQVLSADPSSRADSSVDASAAGAKTASSEAAKVDKDEGARPLEADEGKRRDGKELLCGDAEESFKGGNGKGTRTIFLAIKSSQGLSLR